MRGRHVLKVWSTTQATIALSSAEAELIAAVRGAAEGLAMKSILSDLGEECGLRICLDSSAAIWHLPPHRRQQNTPPGHKAAVDPGASA